MTVPPSGGTSPRMVLNGVDLLAGAVGSEQTEHLAGIERKADVVADDHSAITQKTAPPP